MSPVAYIILPDYTWDRLSLSLALTAYRIKILKWIAKESNEKLKQHPRDIFLIFLLHLQRIDKKGWALYWIIKRGDELISVFLFQYTI